MQTSPIRVGLFGENGHQIHHHLANHPRAKVGAIAAFRRENLPDPLTRDASIRAYTTLDDMLRDPAIDLVSLCSPRRADQAAHAIASLEAGKHVYAEKPCASSEKDLDAILAAAGRTGRKFHEMAGTAFDQPYMTMREIVSQGTLGTVVQVLAQKSYPWRSTRPQDEAIDGGHLPQVSIHAVRFIEHVAGVRVAEVSAAETTLGDPLKGGGLRMASTMMMKLENGGLATIVANYFNPKGIGRWGNEELRIWGTKGMLESTDAGTRTRLIVGEEDRGALTVGKSLDYFDLFLDELLGVRAMPLSLDEELHPTRIVIRANASAKSHAKAPL